MVCISTTQFIKDTRNTTHVHTTYQQQLKFAVVFLQMLGVPAKGDHWSHVYMFRARFKHLGHFRLQK